MTITALYKVGDKVRLRPSLFPNLPPRFRKYPLTVDHAYVYRNDAYYRLFRKNSTGKKECFPFQLLEGEILPEDFFRRSLEDYL